MELDWSTFLLEIVNFLVLVWLLKRFLFRPVMKVIEARKAAIAKTIAESNRLHNEAKGLQSQYEHRLIEWEQEKEKARMQLQEDLAADRQRRLAALQVELEKEQEQASARAGQQIREAVRQAETTAIEHGARFAGTLLSRIASPEIEAKLLDAVLEDLSQLPDREVAAVRSALPANAHGRVTTAYPLNQDSRERLIQAVERQIKRSIEWDFTEDRSLLAGLRLSLGAWVLRGNIQDELKFFTEGETGGC